jgi:hypothetical protein
MIFLVSENLMGRIFKFGNIKLQSNFCGLDSLEILEGVEILNNVESAIAWKREDMQAHNILTQSIDDTVLTNLLSCETCT